MRKKTQFHFAIGILIYIVLQILTIRYQSVRDDKGLERYNENRYINTKQTLVLHVGPPKTGTTTLQYGLFRIKEMLLSWDRYIYIAKFDDAEVIDPESWIFWQPHIVAQGIRKYIRDTRNKRFNNTRELDSYIKRRQSIDYKKNWNQPNRELNISETTSVDHLEYFYTFVEFLNSFYDEKRSVIISAEQFCFNDVLIPDSSIAWDVFLPPLRKWDVHVVVTYRRYYEWITSYYYQLNLVRPLSDRKETLASFVTNVLEQAHELKEKGRLIETHPTYHAYTKYKRHFNNVTILNLHETRDEGIVKTFICDFVPNARRTCSHLSHTEQDKSDLRRTKGLEFHILIQAAAERNMTTPYITNIEVFQKVLEKAKVFYIEKFNRPFPYICLPEDITKEIFDMSQFFEKEILPDWYETQGNQMTHLEGYMAAIKTKKFCDIDHEKVLNEKEWKEFFATTVDLQPSHDFLLEVLRYFVELFFDIFTHLFTKHSKWDDVN